MQVWAGDMPLGYLSQARFGGAFAYEPSPKAPYNIGGLCLEGERCMPFCWTPGLQLVLQGFQFRVLELLPGLVRLYIRG